MCPPSRADSGDMRWALAAGALCATVALATGCGSAEVVSLENVANAAVKTEGVGTARFTFKGSVTFNHDHAQRFEFKGHGVADWRNNSAEMKAVYRFPNAIQEFIKEQFGGPATADLILDGREGLVLYMRFPFLKQQLPRGKPWMKADIAKMGKAYGLDLDRLKETKQSDPDQMLDYLKSAVGVRRIGSDLVRREVTTHYSTVVKAETIVEQAPRDQQKAMREFLRLMGIKTYPVDIWVDRDGLVRRLAIELEYKQPHGEYVKMKVSEEYYDFGVEVNIKPPPARHVLDVTPRFRTERHSPRRLTS
jgi:hypothetical protein